MVFMMVLHSSSLLLSPTLSSILAAWVSIPDLSPGDASSWVGRCLQAISKAMACSLSPLYTSLSLPHMMPLLLVLATADLSSRCWVFPGLAPAITLIVASCRYSLFCSHGTSSPRRRNEWRSRWNPDRAELEHLVGFLEFSHRILLVLNCQSSARMSRFWKYQARPRTVNNCNNLVPK